MKAIPANNNPTVFLVIFDPLLKSPILSYTVVLKLKDPDYKY